LINADGAIMNLLGLRAVANPFLDDGDSPHAFSQPVLFKLATRDIIGMRIGLAMQEANEFSSMVLDLGKVLYLAFRLFF
jgi:hypothetical protein